MEDMIRQFRDMMASMSDDERSAVTSFMEKLAERMSAYPDKEAAMAALQELRSDPEKLKAFVESM
ncbi:MAG: hypothetical protein IKR73_04830 [Oscillospiraceae bacterium]|nr:hypothetical protein [Oscillospiraceae bacterium]